MNLSTIRRVTVTINQVMKYAVRHGYIDHNPVRDAERPRDRGEIEKPKIKILNTIQINSFLGSVDDTEYKTLFMCYQRLRFQPETTVKMSATYPFGYREPTRFFLKMR